jgi:sugar phosphate isomerase/epimerase
MRIDDYSRRDFLRQGLQTAGGLVLTPTLLAQTATSQPATTPASSPKKFEISLAAWSVHRMFFADKIKQIDMPELCRKEFDIGGLELVNSFFASPQYTYCKDLRKRAEDSGVKILLIMCDGEGDMCHSDPTERRQAVRNHRKWLDAAHLLGCHSIRCNASGAEPGDPDAVKRCAESFAALVELARPDKLNVIIENHWGFSSDPDALLAVLKEVNDPFFGTLPDFGNFPPEADRYEAVRKMMPYAKGVSAKCYGFDREGNETTIDYARMMRIVLDAGYRGFVGIEYEGKNPDEIAGVKTCKRLLERFQ